MAAPMTDERAKELGLWCIANGSPGAMPDHMDCPVIVRRETEVAGTRRDAVKLPALCRCECLTCKRAWWDMGRPMTRSWLGSRNASTPR